MGAEVHEHFDNDDKRLGYTVVHRESPWDDATQKRALQLVEHEDSLCPCGCGQPMDLAHDPEQTWFVDTFTCHAEKARESVARKRREREEKKGDAMRPGWDDGLHYTVRPHDPKRDKPREPQPRRRVRGPRAD